MAKENQQIYKVVLLSGALFFNLGIVQAYQSPASEYELSIYASTPVIFWIGVTSLLLMSVFYVFYLERLYKEALFLGNLSVISVYCLPLIRNYYFVSEGDALSHLGTVTQIKAGILNPWHNFYPATHVLSVIVGRVSNISPERSMFVTILLFVVLFIVFIPVGVRRLYSDDIAIAISYVSGWLLLPVGRHGLHFAPNGLGRLYMIFSLSLLIVFITTREYRMMLLFSISVLTFVFIHSQMMLSFILVLTGFCASFVLLSRKYSNSEFVRLEKMIFLGVLYSGIVWYLWIESQARFVNAIQGFILSLFTPTPGADSATLAVSLEAVGGSIGEIFIKLFFVPFMYIVLAIYLFLHRSINIRKKWPYTNSNDIIVLCTFIGIFPLLVLFMGSFLTSIHYMRYFYTALTITTLLGAMGLFVLYRETLRKHSNAMLTFVLVVLLVLSMLTVFPSPYIYQANKHVPESQVQGYDTAFTYSSESIEFVRVRSPVSRYLHATQGRTGVDYREYTGAYRAGTPDHFADQQLHQYYDDPKYLAITEADRQRDPILWEGLRYTEDDFEYLDRNRNIQKISTNNQFDLYKVK